ncbi:unnamed protein product [Miscanthus lutarioriparius]|uniref:Uncharacterized protein n=1 Tax=Miscanthus lutarioriparius TaxID=422564 RepID=A0A811PPA1_9POAL|nr:unnamed protein product [Miscanthus lutarioriparius]
MTGRYTVLHLPCRADVTGGFTSLQVFTLRVGDEDDPSRAWAWRDVPVSFPGGATATCSVDAGLVTVDGATYWVRKDAGRVALAAPLQVVRGPGSGYVLRLAEVRGRLGLAVRADRRGPSKTEVSVLGRQGWSRQYSVLVQAAEVWQRLAARTSRTAATCSPMRDSGEVRSMRIREQGTVAAYCKDGYHLRAFAYVETTEPLLSVFKTTATKLSS